MQYVLWNRPEGRWAGICPRCGNKSFFESKYTLNSPGRAVTAEVLYCAGEHAIFVEYSTNDVGKQAAICCPIEHGHTIPPWLPEAYKDTYRELLDVKSRGNRRSVVALCGVLLEAHVNDLIRNPGEKKKSLFARLELLNDQGLIDKDQLSNATITRITRNEVLHPEEILVNIEEAEVQTVFEEVTNFFERSYKFRSSRALPQGSPTKTEGSDVK